MRGSSKITANEDPMFSSGWIPANQGFAWKLCKNNFCMVLLLVTPSIPNYVSTILFGTYQIKSPVSLWGQGMFQI